MAKGYKPSHPVVICGAKRRDGNACQQTALANGKCRLHGGLSPGPPKGNQNNSKMGIYASVLSDEDRAIGDASETGSLDPEIRLLRIQIARVERARLAYDDCVRRGEIPTKHLVQTKLHMRKVERTGSSGGDDGDEYAKSETVEEQTMERPDFEALIDRFTGRLDKLEKTHALLTGQINSDGEGSSASVTVRVIGGLANTAPKTGN